MKSKHRAKAKPPAVTRHAGSPVVSAAYAKLKFADLLKAVERGETVTIQRYNKPVAKLSPAREEIYTDRELGFLKGVVKILDPDWEKHLILTDEEMDQLSKATY